MEKLLQLRYQGTLRTTNEMLDEFAFLGERQLTKIVIENTNALAEIFEPVGSLKATAYTFHWQGWEGAVAELTYKKLLKSMEITPRYRWFTVEKELTSIRGMDLLWFIWLHRCWCATFQWTGVTQLVLVGPVGPSFVAATMIGITEVNPLSLLCLWSVSSTSEFITDGSYGSGFDMLDKKTVKLWP